MILLSIQLTIVIFSNLLLVSQFSESKTTFRVQGNMLLLNDQPFYVKGICYSPVPTGDNPSRAPFGDYFTPDYAYLWKRDLPLIKSMGANTIRIYSWNNSNDHMQFFDEVHANGLFVFVTYFIGSARQTPVGSPNQRRNLVYHFSEQVWLYKNHPAILMWGFGNELNGDWNGFLTQFDSIGNCGWKGCLLSKATSGHCFNAIFCVYKGLFGLINDACAAAKKYSTHLCTSSLADIDYVVTSSVHGVAKIGRFDWLMTAMDVWSVQIYRGASFGSVFQQFGGQSSKPLLITEYGTDAYNDPCGWDENRATDGKVCFNTPNDGNGGADVSSNFKGCNSKSKPCKHPGVTMQANWNVALTTEIINHHSLRNVPSNTGRVSIGGLVMAWHDEYWKNSAVQNYCVSPCPISQIKHCQSSSRSQFYVGGSKHCKSHSHITCNNWDSTYPDLCGYLLPSGAPDNYVNEAWFGLTQPHQCYYSNWGSGKYHLDELTLRPVFYGLRSLWGGYNLAPLNCEQLKTCHDCLTSNLPLRGKDWLAKCNLCKNQCLQGSCSKNLMPKIVFYCRDLKPCQNGGGCVDDLNGYICACPAKYFGINCQNGMYTNSPCTSNSDCLSEKCVDGICRCNEENGSCKNNNEICNSAWSTIPKANQCMSGYCAPDGFCACPDSLHASCLTIGVSCSSNSACISGYCNDGVCCRTNCTGVCQRCNEPNSTGICKIVPVGYDPYNECKSSSKNTCGLNGKCDGNGHCGYWSKKTECHPINCFQGTLTRSFCSGNGDCINTNEFCGKSERIYTCLNKSTCATSCTSDLNDANLFVYSSNCQKNAYCDNTINKCVSKRNQGAECQLDIQCLSSYCTDGICCNNRCQEDCYSCTLGDGNETYIDGKCIPVPYGLNPDGHCPSTSICNMNQQCKKKQYQSCVSDTECLSQFCYNGVCIVDGNECDPFPCQNNGTCIDDIANYSCVCQTGYAGHNCSINIDDCAINPCQNSGVCQDGINNYTCECPGYDGWNCSNEIDECLFFNCMNGGTCIDHVGFANCSCIVGFTGLHCEINVDDCAFNPCQNNGTCIDGQNNFSCICPSDLVVLKGTNVGELCQVITPIQSHIVVTIAVLIVTGVLVIGITSCFAYHRFNVSKKKNNYHLMEGNTPRQGHSSINPTTPIFPQYNTRQTRSASIDLVQTMSI